MINYRLEQRGVDTVGDAGSVREDIDSAVDGDLGSGEVRGMGEG
jgi:hypothetical protein